MVNFTNLNLSLNRCAMKYLQGKCTGLSSWRANMIIRMGPCVRHRGSSQRLFQPLKGNRRGQREAERGQPFKESSRSRICWPSWNDIFSVWKEIWAVGNLQMNASANEWMHQTQWKHCVQDYTILLIASTSKEFVSPPSASVLFHYQIRGSENASP